MKLIGIDYGDKKIGIAISDETGLIAAPHSVLRTKDNEQALKTISGIISDEKITAIVLGLPTGWENKDSPQTEKVRAFKSMLESNTGLPVELWDESYSTQLAEKGSKGRKREQADSEAARIILQEFLDYRNI